MQSKQSSSVCRCCNVLFIKKRTPAHSHTHAKIEIDRERNTHNTKVQIHCEYKLFIRGAETKRNGENDNRTKAKIKNPHCCAGCGEIISCNAVVVWNKWSSWYLTTIRTTYCLTLDSRHTHSFVFIRRIRSEFVLAVGKHDESKNCSR